MDVEILRNIPTEKFKDQVEQVCASSEMNVNDLQVYERYFMGDEQSINIDSVSMLKLADEHRQRSLKTSSFDDMQEQVGVFYSRWIRIISKDDSNVNSIAVE